MKTFGQLAIHEPAQAFAGGSETTRVDIYGAIGWDVYADEFLAAFREIPEEHEIDLRIHSYGGSVTEGWAMALAIQNHKGRVEGTIEGTAASMASIIAMSCDRLVMPKNSYLMIHRVSGGTWGNADELDNAARLTRQFEDDIVNFYAEKTGIETQEIREMMAVDTWMKGPDALAKGFCHALLEPVKAAAFVGEKTVVAMMGSLPDELRSANGLIVEEEEEETVITEPGEVEETPEELAVEESVEGARGVIDWLGKFLKRGGDDDAPTMMANMAVENSRLIAEGKTLQADLDNAVSERDQLRREINDLNQAATAVHAAIAECGFSRTEAVDLPGPVDDAEEDSGGSSVLEQFESMPVGRARKEFFRDNKAGILQAHTERARNSGE